MSSSTAAAVCASDADVADADAADADGLEDAGDPPVHAAPDSTSAAVSAAIPVRRHRRSPAVRIVMPVSLADIPPADHRPRCMLVLRSLPMLSPMATWPATGSELMRSLHRSLLVIGGAGLLLGGGVLLLSLPNPWGDALPIAYTGVFWMFLVTGIVAWWRRPSNAMGGLMVTGGFAVFLGSLIMTAPAALEVIGAVTATAILAVIVHLLLAFPSGRLHSAVARSAVIAAYVVALPLQVPLYVFAPIGQSPPLIDAPLALDAGILVQRLAGAAVMVTATVVLGSRIRRAEAAHRRVLLPLFSYGIFAILFVVTAGGLLEPLGLDPVARVLLQLAVIGGIPLAFTVAVFAGGFAPTGALEELATWLGTATRDGDEIGSALAQTLGDDSVRLLFRLDDRSLVDAAGHAVTVGPSATGRAFIDVTRAERTIAVISYDPRLVADPAQVRRAGRIVATAIERERLTAQLRATEQELRRSRRRLVVAADDERRRIARDLHDGAQVQLVLLSVQAQQLADAQPNRELRRSAASLRMRIDATADELRGLVHALMPAALVERGLDAAVEDLVDRMPVPTRSRLDPVGQLPPDLESTAYFVVAEALANTVKHARASSAAVRISRVRDVLRVIIEDDGVGRARMHGAGGLRGMADRVAALDGRLEVGGGTGGGTRILVELPCGS